MTDINNVTIVGRLVKNAEFRHIGGVTNARFTLADDLEQKARELPLKEMCHV